MNLNRVSDNDYFADFGASVLAASQRILPTTIQMNGILNGWSYQAGYQGYQVLQDPGAPILPPYEWSPKFALSKNTDFLIGYRETDIILNAEATHFTHPSLTDGTRLIGKANLSTPFNFGPIRLVPAANLHYTLYRKSKDGNLSRQLKGSILTNLF